MNKDLIKHFLEKKIFLKIKTKDKLKYKHYECHILEYDNNGIVVKDINNNVVFVEYDLIIILEEQKTHK